MIARKFLSAGLMLVCVPALLSAASGKPDEGAQARALATLAQASGLAPTDSLPVKCGLPLIAYARTHRGAGSAGVLSALDLLDQRPSLQTSVLAGRFRIHFDTAGINTPAMLDPTHTVAIPGTVREFVDSVAATAASVFHLEVDSLGYAAPPADGETGGGPEYDLYIMSLGGVYGYTATDSNAMPEGGRSSTHIVIDNKFLFLQNVANRGLRALHVTLAHEFHHAIQIGGYGFWSTEVYYHEMTSVWMEGVAYPDVDDYLQYVFSSSGQFANPGVPFTSNGFIMYSRGIWGHFLARKFGIDAMRRSWEEIRSSRPLIAINTALQRYYSTGFPAAFAEWTLWNYFTGSRADSADYYPAGARYKEMISRTVSYSGVARSIVDTIPPLSCEYFQVVGGTTPVWLIAANIDYASSLAGSLPGEGFAFQVDPIQTDARSRLTAAGFYVRLDAGNPTSWWSWDVANGVVGTPVFNDTQPFPNPFLADGASRVYVPSTATEGTLTIYSSSMTLVYHADLQSALRLGSRVFTWDGTTDRGLAAQSGIYVFALTSEGRTAIGKIALVRKR